MTTLTTQQLQDIRYDLGDASNAFGDSELQRLYDRVEGAPNAYIQYRATLGLAWQQIMAGAAKYHDYEAGAVKEKLSQVFEHAQKMAAVYQSDVEAALSQKQEFIRTKVGITPHQTRTEPQDSLLASRRRNGRY